MFQSNRLDRPYKRSQSRIVHVLRSPIVWGGVGLMVILAASIFTLTTNRAVQAKTPVPADLFMQSVVKRDGALGWHQLCPAVQAQMPLSMLVSQVRKQRIAESGKGLRLTVEYIGARARTQDGQIRVYVVSARRADGWSGQRTFIVTTQASGCVEDVTNS
jgi:hypothetical protein